MLLRELYKVFCKWTYSKEARNTVYEVQPVSQFYQVHLVSVHDAPWGVPHNVLPKAVHVSCTPAQFALLHSRLWAFPLLLAWHWHLESSCSRRHSFPTVHSKPHANSACEYSCPCKPWLIRKTPIPDAQIHLSFYYLFPIRESLRYTPS